MKAKANSLVTMLALAEELAKNRKDGHLTIMRFTTHWKATLGTPDLHGGAGYDEVSRLRGFPTLSEALAYLLTTEHVDVRQWSDDDETGGLM